MGYAGCMRLDEHQPLDEAEPRPDAVLPDREWGLSALQTAGIVAAILLACEVIALLG